MPLSVSLLVCNGKSRFRVDATWFCFPRVMLECCVIGGKYVCGYVYSQMRVVSTVSCIYKSG